MVLIDRNAGSCFHAPGVGSIAEVLHEWLARSYEHSVRDCRLSVLNNAPACDVLLDYGCADGEFTQQIANKVGASEVLGVEIFELMAKRARRRGIEIVDVQDGRLAIDDESVDVVTANQLIEHLSDTDSFVIEIHRILRPGGCFIVSTNNLASWHNIVALMIGAQPFPSDVSSAHPGVGKLVPVSDAGAWSSFTHMRVFSYRALIEMMQVYGFDVQRAEGIGYYPLPAKAANRVATTDPRHAAYLTLRCQKQAKVNGHV